MSQHDQNIANDTGAAVRADINLALAAIFGNSSGATAPSTTIAYQWWADTTTGLLKVRNAANSAWVTVGTLATTNLGLFPSTGGTMTGDLLFTDATYDIGKSGATRPRDLFLSRNLTAGGNLVVSGSGPHGIGGAGITRAGMTFLGTVTTSGTIVDVGTEFEQTVTVQANNSAYGVALSASSSVTLNKASSGTHADFVGLYLGVPAIGAGAATLTNATTLKIADAPATGTNKRAFWVAAGSSQFDGDVVLTTVSGAGVATQANMESASATNLLVSPGRQQYHPGHPKAWVNFNGTGTIAVSQSYNVTSLTDNGVGNWTVNFTTAFSGTTYCVTGNCLASGGGGIPSSTLEPVTLNTGSVNVYGKQSPNSMTDFSAVFVHCLGDQ